MFAFLVRAAEAAVAAVVTRVAHALAAAADCFVSALGRPAAPMI